MVDDDQRMPLGRRTGRPENRSAQCDRCIAARQQPELLAHALTFRSEGAVHRCWRHGRIGAHVGRVRERPEGKCTRNGARHSRACSQKLADQEIPSPSRPPQTLTRAPQQQANYLRKIPEALARGEPKKC